MCVIGLTGNLASGKTTVAKMFEHLGTKVLDTDTIARDLLKAGTPTQRKVLKEFGTEILTGPSIDRGKLAKLVFADPKRLKTLNAILHPPVIRFIRREISACRKQKQPVVVEAALLIESGLNRYVDWVVLVVSKQDLQLKRAAQSLKLTPSQARQRLRQQMPVHEKLKYADIVIDNKGTLSQTKKQVEGIWQKLQQRKQKSPNQKSQNQK